MFDLFVRVFGTGGAIIGAAAFASVGMEFVADVKRTKGHYWGAVFVLISFSLALSCVVAGYSCLTR